MAEEPGASLRYPSFSKETETLSAANASPNLQYHVINRRTMIMANRLKYFLFLLLAVFFLSGCKCEHVFTATVTKNPTYNETGVRTFTCEKCKETYTEVIPKLICTHNYVEKITKAPTLEKSGEHVFTCAKCGDSYSESIPHLYWMATTWKEAYGDTSPAYMFEKLIYSREDPVVYGVFDGTRIRPDGKETEIQVCVIIAFRHDVRSYWDPPLDAICYDEKNTFICIRSKAGVPMRFDNAGDWMESEFAPFGRYYLRTIADGKKRDIPLISDATLAYAPDDPSDWQRGEIGSLIEIFMNSKSEYSCELAILHDLPTKYPTPRPLSDTLYSFEIMTDGLKEAVEEVFDPIYQKAVAVFDSGDYKKARLLFGSGLGGYKDTNKYLDLCYSALSEENYQKAVGLFENRQYKEAYEIFEKLGGFQSYKDSNDYLAKCKSHFFELAEPGDIVFFGSYPQQLNGSENPDEIEWLVLAVDGTKKLLISKNALDRQPYNTWGNTSWDR